jgi:hypothetical protein
VATFGLTTRSRSNLEAQIASSRQENASLLDQLAVLRQEKAAQDALVGATGLTVADHAQYRQTVEQLRAAALGRENHAVIGWPDIIWIEYSPAQPYQTTRVGFSVVYEQSGDSFMGLFWRKGESDAWHLFAATRSILECSEYDNEDVRAAFRGDMCHDENGRIAEVE